jgi:RES domain
LSTVVAYRHAAYDTPWWVLPSTRPGRYNSDFAAGPTQYLALHPLGPAAELLRNVLSRPDEEFADQVQLNLWAVLVEDEGVVDLSFETAESYGITPEDLVGSDYGATQAVADRLRGDGVPGLRVPSAALPGTDNLVLFGPKLAHPYLEASVTPEECQTGHLSDAARPAREVLPLVRWSGTGHSALAEWRATGNYRAFDEPLPLRW